MRTFIISFAVLAGCILTGCEKKEYLYRDSTARIWLGVRESVNIGPVVDSAISSFALKPATVLYDTVYIGANITGNAAPVDRPFKLEVVSDSTNVLSSDYTIGAAVMPANAFTVRIPVIVKKNVQGLNLAKQKAQVMVRFVPDENFQQGTPGVWNFVGDNSFNRFRIIWFNFLPQPPTWVAIITVAGAFTQAKYKFIIDQLGISEFSRFQGNFVALNSFQAALRKALSDYNSNPANAGRPEGWPYLDDNGTPLTF